MKKLVEAVATLVPFLASYPLWVKLLIGAWVVLSAVLVIALLFARLPEPAGKTGGTKGESGQVPESSSEGKDTKVTKANDSTPSVTQTIINSPGAIQAGHDVIISADSRLIRSMQLRVTIETRTDPTPPREEQVDWGLGSVIALFTREKERIRFISDYRVFDHQVSETRRHLKFVYQPENPQQILGKPIDFLASIDVLVVNYAEIFETEKFDTRNSETFFRCSVILNGIPISEITARMQPPGALNQGQANLNVAEAFSRIAEAYHAVVSAAQSR